MFESELDGHLEELTCLRTMRVYEAVTYISVPLVVANTDAWRAGERMWKESDQKRTENNPRHRAMEVQTDDVKEQ